MSAYKLLTLVVTTDYDEAAWADRMIAEHQPAIHRYLHERVEGWHFILDDTVMTRFSALVTIYVEFNNTVDAVLFKIGFTDILFDLPTV